MDETRPFNPSESPYGCDPSYDTIAVDGVSVDGPTVYYEQRYWLLPESQILIVDDYQTRGLAEILEDASFED